ncbi:MAG: DUF456 domain-containing protein [Candidatus Eisenbacteria bacterium]
MAEFGQTVLHVVALIGLDAVLLAGLILIPLGLSGNFVILGAGLAAALITGFSTVGWIGLAVMAALVAVGEILEALLGSVMARRYGASKYGMIGAFAGGLLGAILGTPVMPVIGTVIGSFLGTALGALAGELLRGARSDEGTRAGVGALIGRVLASAIKLAIGAGMVVYIVIRTHGGA